MASETRISKEAAAACGQPADHGVAERLAAANCGAGETVLSGGTAERFDALLREALGDEAVRRDEPLANHTTFRIGGPADWLVEPEDVEGVQAVAAACAANGVPLCVMGLGSNILAADAGVRGVVMKLADGFADISIDGLTGTVVAQAGATNADVAEYALAAWLTGYEFAAGIPGTIGGAAIMNAGAYDGEFKDVAVSVTCLTPQGSIVEVPAAEADWSYRHSMMADKGYIVLEATLQLSEGDPRDIKARMDDLAHRRASKQPLDMPSAGSTFKRPAGHYAGKLIQDAGMQGHRSGGAQVSEKHAGFVVSDGTATAADVLQVISDVQDAVHANAGVCLEPEVRMWGFGA